MKKPAGMGIESISVEMMADTTDTSIGTESPNAYVGRILNDRYLITHLLSTGPFNWTFKAADVVLRRDVAVKILYPRLLENTDFLEHFRSHALNSAQLSHENIAVIYDWDVDGSPYLVTELCRGSSLRSMLDSLKSGRGGASQSIVRMTQRRTNKDAALRPQALTPSQVIFIGIQSTSALAHAHSKGIVHQDLSPSNILFDTEGRVKLSDFEVAPIFQQKVFPGISESLQGENYYFAPEQLGDRNEATERTDIYSLALILAEAALGEFPIDEDTSIGSYLRRLNKSPKIPEDLGDLGEVLSLAFQLEPKQRPTAKEFLWHLKGLSGYRHHVPLPTVTSMEMMEVTKVDWKKFAPNVKRVTESSSTPTSSSGETLAHGLAHEEADIDDNTSGGISGWERGSDRGSAEPTIVVPPGSTYSEEGLGVDVRVKTSRLSLLVSSLVVLGAVLVSAFAIYTWVNGAKYPMVPDLMGSDVAELESLNGMWEIRQFEMRDESFAEGQIISTNPPAGSDLKEGSLLAVTVSLGEPLIRLPANLLGSTLAEAELRLSGLGLKMGELTLLDGGTQTPLPREQINFEAYIVEGFNAPTSELSRGSEVPLLVRHL